MKKYLNVTIRLWKLLKPFHRYFYLQLFFTVIIQGITIFNTQLVSKIIDNAIVKDWQKLSLIITIYFGITLIARFIQYFSDKRQMQNSYAGIPQYMQEFSLRTILNLNSSQYIENHSAIRQQVIDRGENSLQRIIETLLLFLGIKEGSKVAFVGYSGAGKTTIVQLLLRSYDYDIGNIKIGDIDLKDMSARSLRENIGYVEQHVDLFDDSIKNNILFGIKDEEKLKSLQNNDSLIEYVAKKARIDQFYHRLGEKRFDTMIGERGVKLSGGERQRVGIARALIKDPAILIFDEATSALDAENEKYIKEAIDEASVGRTAIIIAHRLSTVRDVDHIFMMSNGKIIAEGNHEYLIKNSKEYKNLVELQMN